jgi:hypothetical protein
MKKKVDLFMFMKDWKEILSTIYVPEIGSIWRTCNRIWTSSFASNKDGDDYQPAAVTGKLNDDEISSGLFPELRKTTKKEVVYSKRQIKYCLGINV